MINWRWNCEEEEEDDIFSHSIVIIAIISFIFVIWLSLSFTNAQKQHTLHGGVTS
jgi:hypothetical protein